MNGQDFDRVVAPIRELIAKKGQDYNTEVQLGDYFPFGATSYVQMIHLKATRLRSLLAQKGKPNFDSIKDTLQDLLAYTTFYLHWLELEELKKLQAHSAVAPQRTLPSISTDPYMGVR